LFQVELKPTFNKRDKWSLLIQFKRPYFGSIGSVTYLGKVTLLFEEIEADNNLRIQDRDAWLKKIQSDTVKLFEDYKSKSMKLWDISFFPRYGLDLSNLIPNQLSFLKKYIDNDIHNVLGADVMVGCRELPSMESRISTKNYDVYGTTTTELIREGLLIRDEAAYLLDKHLQNYREE